MSRGATNASLIRLHPELPKRLAGVAFACNKTLKHCHLDPWLLLSSLVGRHAICHALMCSPCQSVTLTLACAMQAVGSHGAASLRPALQRAAGHGQAAVRRAALTGAAQQKLILCSALLSEVGLAEGCGMRFGAAVTGEIDTSSACVTSNLRITPSPLQG